MIAQMAREIQLIRVGDEWGIDFRNEAGDIVHVLVFKTAAEFDAMFDALDDPQHPEWPADAVSLDTWKRPLFVEQDLAQRKNPLTGRYVGGGRGR